MTCDLWAGGASWARILLAGLLTMLAAPSLAAGDELTSLSLEDLLAQEVTSVAKRPQNVKDSPAAVFVIGREDIRRSGATTLPDLLRMVPGAEVADLSAGRSAISVRGFNGATASKLLVLVDGRAIYASALPGVPWDQQLVPVEEIERIEVVRGPGAALWGANAVNGVINVVTKHAVDSLGGAATLQGDTADSGRAFLRQGFRIGENGALRLYGVARQRDGDASYFGTPLRDRAQAWQAGFRFDAEPTERDAITVQGDVQRGRYLPVPSASTFEPVTTPGHFSGENLLARWTRTHADGRASLQLYYDDTQRLENVGETVGRRLYDAEFSNQFQLGSRHSIVWGATFRRTESRVPNSAVITVVHPVHTVWGGYVQDDVSLLPQRLKLSLGAKLEHDRATGTEFQPSVRAIWTDPAGWSLWAAASKAKRTPAARETDVVADLRPLPVLVISAHVDAETLTAYEVGWRGPIGRTATLDVTAYHNRYRDLIGYDNSNIVMLDGQFLLAAVTANIGRARAYGLEVGLDVQARPWWTLKAAASWQDIRTELVSSNVVAIGSLGGDRSPKSQVSLRSMMDLSDSVDLDLWVRRVGKLGDGVTPAYTQLDARLAWRPTPGLELSLRGVNLLGHKSPQARTDVGVVLTAPSAIADRRVSLTAAVRY